MGVFLTSLVAAALAPHTIVQPEVIDAALFKNGYSVIALGATIPDDGDLTIEAPRDAVLGTFWLRASDGKVLEAVASNEEKMVYRDPRDLNEILANSVGKEIHLMVTANGLSKVDGTLVKYTPSAVTPNYYNPNALLTIQVKGESNLLVITQSYVQYVWVPGSQGDAKFGEKVETPVIHIKGLRGTHVVIDMVKKGLWWSPAYSIDISNKDSLRLTARAVIVNDMYDLKGLDLRLVTGFPNLPFLDQVDPMQTANVLSAVMQNSGGFGGGGGMGGARGAGQQLQMANAATFDGRNANYQGISSDEVQGFQAEDLFMYPQKDITLKTGDRMYRQLFDAESHYEHVYTLDLASLDDQNGAPANGQSAVPDVWHEIKFKNTAKLPLTTAPAMVTENGNVIGQDMLTYSSINQDVHVKITKAVDISARQTELETGREKAFVRDANNYPRYDRVKITGTIEIFNRKAEAVKLEANKVLNGDVIEASDQATWVKDPGAMWQLNAPSTVHWQVSLPAAQLTKLTYSYHVLRQATG